LSEHLSGAMLNALADGELTGERLTSVEEHLAECPRCTSSALAQSLLKAATARAGQRYAPPPELRERMVRLAAQASRPQAVEAAPRPGLGFASYAWASVAALVLVFASIYFMQRTFGRDSVAAAQFTGLVTEVCDQHIATIAANAPPEVVSSDRHTVKPWFQGKLPFSFNLPQNLPGDTTLDGANLTYVRNQPAAQLLYSIGKHRVSVFLRQRAGTADGGREAERSGFHVTGFRTGDLDVLAVSDVDEARLADLVGRIEAVQGGAR